jgi:hypothetical protein
MLEVAGVAAEVRMTWKDKLEIGLKDDAPYRRDNLPESQQRKGGPATKPGDSTRSPEEPGARPPKTAKAARRIPRPRGGGAQRRGTTRKKTSSG